MEKTLNINTTKSHVISFVGGGGKTSLMFSLASILKPYGNVLVTTTTKIYKPSSESYDHLFIIGNGDIPNKEGITVVSRDILSENKLNGVSSEDIGLVLKEGFYKFILVEADGAGKMPIKAPKIGEPQIPDVVDINIGVIGYDAIGKKISDVCFRKEIFIDITEKKISDVIDSESIIKLVNHENGLFKNNPRNAKRFLVINKCDGKNQRENGENILRNILDNTNLDKAFISSMKNSFIKEVESNISGIIMASGLSKRMGKQKLLLKVNGLSMIENTASECTLSRLKETLVVYSDKNVLDKCSGYNIKGVYNENPHLGQSKSIEIGLKEATLSRGYMFLVSDQPYIKSSTINSLIREFYKKNCEYIVMPIYGKKQGNPVIFPWFLKDKLIEITGDNGGREVIKNYTKIHRVYFEDESLGMDIDFEEDYRSLEVIK